MSGGPSNLVRLARLEIGVDEDSRPDRVEEYQKATWLPPGEWHWCAAFVCYIVRAWLNEGGREWLRLSRASSDYRPTTPSAFRFEDWAQARPITTRIRRHPIPTPIPVGSLVIFGFSHIGILSDFGAGRVTTIDGNTGPAGSRDGGMVLERTRPLSSVRSVIVWQQPPRRRLAAAA